MSRRAGFAQIDDGHPVWARYRCDGWAFCLFTRGRLGAAVHVDGLEVRSRETGALLAELPYDAELAVWVAGLIEDLMPGLARAAEPSPAQRVARTPKGLRVSDKSEPAEPARVERYLTSKLQGRLEDAWAVMAELAAASRPGRAVTSSGCTPTIIAATSTPSEMPTNTLPRWSAWTRMWAIASRSTFAGHPARVALPADTRDELCVTRNGVALCFVERWCRVYHQSPPASSS